MSLDAQHDLEMHIAEAGDLLDNEAGSGDDALVVKLRYLVTQMAGHAHRLRTARGVLEETVRRARAKNVEGEKLLDQLREQVHEQRERAEDAENTILELEREGKPNRELLAQVRGVLRRSELDSFDKIDLVRNILGEQW